jgi:phage gp46-like protein
MMRRSKKPLGSGDREYFNEKRPVNVRVDATAYLAETLAPLRECRRIQAITVVLSAWSIRKRSTLMSWKWRDRVLFDIPAAMGVFRY